jgi:hypothetical protein
VSGISPVALDDRQSMTIFGSDGSVDILVDPDIFSLLDTKKPANTVDGGGGSGCSDALD